LTGKSVESKIRMHKKKEGRGKYFLSLFFLDDFSNLMGTFGTNVNSINNILTIFGRILSQNLANKLNAFT
ncbi:MAG: hypothetical protein K9N06_14070, partial [Candidatus Cloacimonetes bacterium]|nr:hypothetical protein [Candidatus Cloacimonadota bacterium]